MEIEKKSLSEKLYNHWTMFPLMLWGVVGLFVIPVWAIVRPTNYDFIIVITMMIIYGITCAYVFAVSEAESSRNKDEVLKRLFENKNFSSEELGDRVDMYRRMFK